MRPRHFTSFSVIVSLAKPASYTTLGLVGSAYVVAAESSRADCTRPASPLPMRAAQLFVKLVSWLRLGWVTDSFACYSLPFCLYGWVTGRNSSAIIVLSHDTMGVFFSFLFENFSKVFTTDFWWFLLFLLQKRPQFQTIYTSWTAVNVGQFCVLGYDGLLLLSNLQLDLDFD